jgi:hypothetical protein
MTCSFIVASNSEPVLRSCLLASPDLEHAEVSVQRSCRSAAVAYNRGMDCTRSEVMVFAHQDLYLPGGWLQRLEAGLDWLGQNDPNWGVLGIFGVDTRGAGQGHIYSAGRQAVLGAAFAGAKPVETLDEVLLILRRSSGLRFDEELPGFHMYGADICVQAKVRGLKAYAIAAFGIHNSNGIGMLPLAYWRCWWRLRRKWSAHLPVAAPCMPVTRWGVPALRYVVGHSLWLARHPGRVHTRVPDPAEIWKRLRTEGVVCEAVARR